MLLLQQQVSKSGAADGWGGRVWEHDAAARSMGRRTEILCGREENILFSL